jgi:alkanesulfonate monooxygenase SsuD/methylene tetrahydromethanopterin reductase-like flavin-dependent oxidoreductase (luciferase family)
VAGSPDDCIEQIQAFVERGIELLVVDLRLLMGEFEEAAERFATDVIPAFASHGRAES